MNCKTECINCYKRLDFTENICQDCLFKLYDKAEKLKEIEGRVGEVFPIIGNLQQYYYEEHGANSFNIVLDKIKKILGGK